LIILGILLDKEIAKTNQLSATHEQLMEEKEDCIEYHNFRQAEVFFNGKNLIRNAFITDGKGNRIDSNEIMENNKLVFYFSESSCSMCVDMEIARINEKADLIVSENTIIFISSHSKLYVAQYKNNNKQLKIPIYEIKSDKDDFLPMIPFYFVIEKESKRINSAFFPSKYTPDETDKYLNKIADDYFK
jgi:hypothetical protein